MKLVVVQEFNIDVAPDGLVSIEDTDGIPMIWAGTLTEAVEQAREMFAKSLDKFTVEVHDIIPANKPTEARTYEERHAFDEHVEAEPVRTDKQIRDDINLRAVITSHLAVEDWSQDGPEAFTCYLAVGHFFGRDTSFTVNSLERMLRILNSEAIDVVDNP